MLEFFDKGKRILTGLFDGGPPPVVKNDMAAGPPDILGRLARASGMERGRLAARLGVGAAAGNPAVARAIRAMADRVRRTEQARQASVDRFAAIAGLPAGTTLEAFNAAILQTVARRDVLCSALALPPDATQADILNEIDARQHEASQVRAESREREAYALVEAAINEQRIGEAAREFWLDQALRDLERTRQNLPEKGSARFAEQRRTSDE